MPQDDIGNDLKDLTLKELEATRDDMLLLENKDAAKAAGAEASKKYSETLFAIQDAIRDLRNAELLKLLQQLRSHESDLREGIKDLKKARKNIGHVEDFLKVATKVLLVMREADLFAVGGTHGQDGGDDE
jgi:tRNA-dihydrouridine synthase